MENKNKFQFGGYWPTVALVVVAAAVGFVVGRGTTDKDAGLASLSEGSVEEMLGIDGDTEIDVMAGDGTEVEKPASQSVLVMDQPAGNKVIIEKLSLSKESWVAIHDYSSGGPGWILGAQKFPIGNYDKFEVKLLRSTESGKKYVAMIHVSGGDDKFEFRASEADRPFLDEGNKPLMSEFQILAEKK